MRTRTDPRTVKVGSIIKLTPGGEGPAKVKVVAVNKGGAIPTIVVKLAGYSYWYQRLGPRGYQPAEYHVLDLSSHEYDEKRNTHTLTTITSFPSRSR